MKLNGTELIKYLQTPTSVMVGTIFNVLMVLGAIAIIIYGIKVVMSND